MRLYIIYFGARNESDLWALRKIYVHTTNHILKIVQFSVGVAALNYLSTEVRNNLTKLQNLLNLFKTATLKLTYDIAEFNRTYRPEVDNLLHVNHANIKFMCTIFLS